jgi:hypothetical protein
MKKTIKNTIRTVLNEFYSLDEFTSKVSISPVSTYEELDQFLGNKDERKIAHNTYVHKRLDDNIGIKLWRTDIIVINKLNNIRVYTGGWESRTTADRLNQLLPSKVRVYSKKGIWRISGVNGDFEFEEGIVVTPDGHILS